MSSISLRSFALASLVVLAACDGKSVAPPVGSFSLSTDGFTAAAAQGGGAVGTLIINRVDGHSAPVTLAATGVPAGVTASFGSTTATTTGTWLAFSVSGSVAPGAYPITITGNAAGFTEQTTPITLTVVAPPSTASVSMPFCSTLAWFAYKNEGYQWQTVSPVSGVFTFLATAAPIVAYVSVTNNGTVNESVMTVLHATRAELGSQTDRDCSGPKSLTGSMSGAATGQSARISMGARVTTATAANPSFSLSAVADRLLDLIATKGVITSASGNLQVTPDLVLLQRGLNPTAGASLGTLDFGGQGFAPASSQLTVANLAVGDFMNIANTFWSNTHTYGVIHAFQPTIAVNTLYSMPLAQLATGDMQELFVETYQSGFQKGRYNISYLADITDRTETLGPMLSTPSTETISTAPYVRVRGSVATQAEYPTATRFLFYQNGGAAADRLVYLVATAGYLGAPPATSWDLVIPTFGPVAGLVNSWLPSTGNLEYQAEAYAGPGTVLFGGVPTAGNLVKVAYQVASTSSPSPSILGGSELRAAARRRIQPGQYFRR